LADGSGSQIYCSEESAGAHLEIGLRGWRAGGDRVSDVAEVFARWSKTAKVAIYSSGSVEAQKLIFRYSSAGDLTLFITSYFDTRTGAKTSSDSYRAIAAAMGVATSEILFVSDLLRELILRGRLGV